MRGTSRFEGSWLQRANQGARVEGRRVLGTQRFGTFIKRTLRAAESEGATWKRPDWQCCAGAGAFERSKHAPGQVFARYEESKRRLRKLQGRLNGCA